jgi:hypothetical protein
MVNMGQVHCYRRRAGWGMLEGEGSGLKALAGPGAGPTLGVLGLAPVDVVNMLVNSISLLPLKSHQGLELFPLGAIHILRKHFFFINNNNIFTNFLSNCTIKISNYYSMKISSKFNVEKEILLF